MTSRQQHPAELQERAVAMVLDLRAESGRSRGTLKSVGRELGINPVTLRHWVEEKTRREILEITPRMADVLKVFLEDPGQPRYGSELGKRTGMCRGGLYPMLVKLERAGWLSRDIEDVNPNPGGRPPRTFFTLTEGTASAVRIQLAELSERYRPPG